MIPAVSVRFLQTQSDERLLALAGKGHERAFEALVLRYRSRLLAYCRRLLLPSERAEDAVQQGLLQAWLALQKGTEVRDVRPWLYRIVHNSAVSALRSSGYDHAQLADSLRGAGAPDTDLDRRIAVREALAGLASLPEMQREALLRTAIDGSGYDAVAAELGLTEGAVRGLVYRARTTMRAAATALTPAPTVGWLASAGRHSAPFGPRLAELAAGGGATGLTGVLVKGGVVAVTAGVALAGSGAVHVGHATADAAGRMPPRAAMSVTAGRGTRPSDGASARGESGRQSNRYSGDAGGRGSDRRRGGSGDQQSGEGGGRGAAGVDGEGANGDSGTKSGDRRRTTGPNPDQTAAAGDGATPSDGGDQTGSPASADPAGATGPVPGVGDGSDNQSP